MKMKLSEMKNKVSGLPDGFVGVKMSWDEVNETFQIVKAFVLERDKINEKGEKILYQKGPKQGQPVPDRQVAFPLHTESGKQLIVRTNSPRLTSLYSGDLDRDPDNVNRFGDKIFAVEDEEINRAYAEYLLGSDEHKSRNQWLKDMIMENIRRK